MILLMLLQILTLHNDQLPKCTQRLYIIRILILLLIKLLDIEKLEKMLLIDIEINLEYLKINYIFVFNLDYL